MNNSGGCRRKSNVSRPTNWSRKGCRALESAYSCTACCGSQRLQNSFCWCREVRTFHAPMIKLQNISPGCAYPGLYTYLLHYTAPLDVSNFHISVFVTFLSLGYEQLQKSRSSAGVASKPQTQSALFPDFPARPATFSHVPPPLPAAPMHATTLAAARFASLWTELDLPTASREWQLRLVAVVARCLWLTPAQCCEMVSSLVGQHGWEHAEQPAMQACSPSFRNTTRRHIISSTSIFTVSVCCAWYVRW